MLILRLSRSARYCVILMALAVSAPAVAEEAFVLDRFNLSYHGSLMQLDLVVDIELPDYIGAAVEQGFAVPLMFEFEILAKRNYWFDDRVIALKQRYLLNYQPMLDSYVVYDINASIRHYFGDFSAAVHFVEVAYRYPLFDVANFSRGRDYYARLRFGIDTDALPRRLKSSALWDNDWDLQSEWHEQEVVRPEP